MKAEDSDYQLGKQLLAKTEKTDTCWLWKGWRQHGYGKIEYSGKTHQVHRLSYALHIAPIEAKVKVRQTCGIKNCINPAHLELEKTLEKDKKRLWEKVDILSPAQCWVWKAAVNNYGHPIFDHKPARRLVYEWERSSIPAGMMVLNSCDNALCVNPSHLSLAESARGSTVERFWRRVKRTNTCWLWTGSILPNGYGKISIKHRDVLAHRYSYELLKGKIPDGHLCLHKCDVRNCVNPEHLFTGTHLDNMEDRNRKKRQAKGHQMGAHSAKLSDEQVKEIRSQYSPGNTSQRQLAEEYGLNQSQISRILTRKRYKHVP